MSDIAIRSLGYLGIESQQTDAWRRFLTTTLGLMETVGDANPLRFRLDDQGWRIAVHEGPAEDLAYVGLDAGSADNLAVLGERLEQAGYGTARDPELAAARGVSELVRTTDPDGLAVELYCGATELGEVPFASPAGVSGFVTGEQGLGHFVLYTPDAARKQAFYVDTLGFKLSDTILMHGKLALTFLHCNPRHHTLALAEVPLDKHLNHFMLQARTLNDVGFACDRVIGAKALSSSLGCHTNDRMVSFYAYTPSGFEVEFGYGAREIGEDWTVAHHNAPSIWGHHRQPPQEAGP